MQFNRNKLHSDFVKTRAEKEAKKGAFINLTEAAREMGISRSTFWRALNKGKVPDTETMVLICKWIGKPIETYFDEM
jgi:predicted DNA-binding transcriptional regulator AlpA